MEAIGDDVALGAVMGADADVVGDRHAREQRDVLEGAADADVADAMRRLGQDALTFHQDVALARLVQPAQAIEQRGLAGAVRADQSEDLAATLIERDVVQRDDAAEHNAHLANGKQDVPLRCYSSVHVWRPVAGVREFMV